MEVFVAMLFVSLVVGYCQSECQPRYNQEFYLTDNSVLKNNAFQWKTVSSRVICGRDCSMDPRCASFNYHMNSHVCELNNATSADRPADFFQIQGSAYYDTYSSCQILYKSGIRDNGIYTIFPAGLTDGVQVYCDMETDGGGWIVFQKRQNGSIDFYRSWAEYQSGFGSLSSEFWLGNDILRTLTESGRWQLRIELTDWENNVAWASYGNFDISGEKYTIHVGSFDGNEGDSMGGLNGQPFTTKDENHGHKYKYAVSYHGAWWFSGSFRSHLNGQYYALPTTGRISQGIYWYTWKGYEYSLKMCSMKIREQPTQGI